MKKLLLVGLLAAPASTASGDDVPGVVYELVDGSGSSFDRFEASGASYFAGQLLIVDDMVNTLFVFDTAGRLSARLEASGFLDEQAKFEDIAYLEAQNTFFAVGSHSGWSEEWLRRFSVLYEFRVASGTIEEASVRRLDLTPAFERLGLWKPHGMKIEGLAVDPSDQYLFVGLREPVDRARVYAFPLEALRRGDPSLRPDVWVEFDAGFVENTPYCISALLWEPTLQGLLVTTSTEEEPSHRFLGNRLWFVAPDREPVLLLDRFDEGMKAEGLTAGGGSLFIAFDNDQDDTTIPSRLRVLPLDTILEKLDAK